jgi:hypothetical protein
VKRQTARKSVRRAGRKSTPPPNGKPVAPRRVAKGRQGSATPADSIDALVAAQAAALRLPLDPSWQGGVASNLQLILRLGAMVDDFALPDDAEPGPVFHA